MTPPAFRSMACLGLLTACAAAWSPRAAGQAVVVDGGERETLDALTSIVARDLGFPTEIVRIEVIGGVLSVADSVDVRAGSTGRWIATMWNGSGAIRRFVRVGLSRPVPVAARALDRGEEVGSEDVRIEPRVEWEPRREPLADPTGMVTTRAVAAGEALGPPSVRAPLLFRGGDEVQAVLEQSGISMRVQATALASAREGEAVSVRLTSGKRMSGKAVGPGLVHLIPGGV